MGGSSPLSQRTWKKTKGTDNTTGQTLHQEVEQDETEDATDGDDSGCDDPHGRDRKTRHLKSVAYTSNSFVSIHDKEKNVV